MWQRLCNHYKYKGKKKKEVIGEIFHIAPTYSPQLLRYT